MSEAPGQNIKVLPENLINKIAAGEVIDRPSSVVKELIENSIDAGADQITVILRDGGRALIQVMDNGCGMAERDAIMSFQRHATSKIRTFGDISHISTLGFRGEALASIASVSQVEMRTIPAGQIEGTLLQIEGGVVQRVDRTGGNAGTSMAIKNIFFNTPARRKFLRSGPTEFRHIIGVLNRFTLAYAEIGFQLFADDNQVFNLKAAPLLQRVSDVLGGRSHKILVELRDENAMMKISGYLGNADALRKARTDQYIYVNRRYVNDRTISAAVMAGYGDSIPRGAFPLYMLFITIEPERVDVNVHPTKSEVKFADQQMIFSVVRGAVKRALLKDDIIPDFPSQGLFTDRESSPRFDSPLSSEMRKNYVEQLPIVFDDASPPDVQSRSPQSNASRQESFQSRDTVLVWQLHNKYILTQIKSGLVIIDQHAAHERIMYDRVKKSFSTSGMASQQLLFPQTIELSVNDHVHLSEIIPLLLKLGFMIKEFGATTVVVEGVPSGMRIGAEDKILLEILDEYKLNLGTESDVQERVAKSFACRSAIMSGQKLSLDEMNELLSQLFSSENPYFCPHGRPVMITISNDELDKRFERK
jgi:DNA mismatch repair protein MutL